MENGMTMGDCLRTNKLIILRGNSGSGKTTIAKELQQVFGNNTMLISQDVIRRDMLKVKDGENTKALPLLEELLRYGRKHSEIVILEGILNAEWYRALFELAVALYPKIRTIVTQNLRFENTKPGQEQAVPFDGLCSPASSAYG